MKTIIVIATRGRADLLKKTVQFLVQDIENDCILCATSSQDVPDFEDGKIRVLFSDPGLCKQRNIALETIASDADIVVFFDDDFVPAPGWIRSIEAVFNADPSIVGITGRVLFDGANGPGLSFDDAKRLLHGLHEPVVATTLSSVEPVHSVYGCNMAIRISAIGTERFDERLPLYGWLEDFDFSKRLGSKGRIVRVDAACGVHLGTKSGRISGIRFGYSQIANVVYLIKKGTMPLRQGLVFVARSIVRNAIGLLWSEAYIDRRGRFRGNMIALTDLARGTLDPERILMLR